MGNFSAFSRDPEKYGNKKTMVEASFNLQKECMTSALEGISLNSEHIIPGNSSDVHQKQSLI